MPHNVHQLQRNQTHGQVIAQAHPALSNLWFWFVALAVVFAGAFYFWGYYYWAYLWRVLTGG